MAQPPLKVFVISLDRAVDRRAHMENLLAGLGLRAEFVSAVDGRALSEADLAQYDARLARMDYRAEMTPSEIACYLSHYRIYERICREALPLALILEDDIHIEPNFLEAVNALAAQDEPEWTVARLQTQRGRLLNPRDDQDLGRRVCALGQSGLYQLDTHVLGGCAYLMRLPAARTMVAYARNISRPIDQTLDRFWENGILPYVVRPFPVRQHPEFDSEIGLRGKEAYLKATGLGLVDDLAGIDVGVEPGERCIAPIAGLSPHALWLRSLPRQDDMAMAVCSLHRAAPVQSSDLPD